MRIDLKIEKSAYEEMNSELTQKIINPMVDRIASKANAASSWGAYGAWNGDYTGRVNVLQGTGDTERGRRLLALMNQETV